MPDVYQKYTDAIDWYVEQHQERPRPRPQVRGRRHRAALPQLAGGAPAPGRDHRALLRDQAETSASRPTTPSCRPTSSTTTSRTRSRRTARSASCSTSPTSSANRPAARRPRPSPYLERIAQIKSSVKTTIITKRLQLSMENEEKGTNKELTVCREGAGGIAIVTGVAAPPASGEKPGGRCGGRPSKISTELDVGPGARPHRRRQREPQGLRARRPRSTTPASSTRSCSSSARRPSATSASTATTPTRSGARRRSGTRRATTTGSSSSTRRSRAT